MNNSYTQAEIIDILNSKEVIDFINKYNVVTMIAFGSITNDAFTEESDVDLALLSYNEIPLDNILEIEMFLQRLLNREIDILDLRSTNLDLFLKINILNTGKVIHSVDNNRLLDILYNETDRLYRENENFIYFRRVDVLS